MNQTYRCKIVPKEMRENCVDFTVTIVTYDDINSLKVNESPIANDKYLVTVNSAAIDGSGVQVYPVNKANNNLMGIVRSSIKYLLIQLKLNDATTVEETTLLRVDDRFFPA